MIVGFTGTQVGMTEPQWRVVTTLITHFAPKEVHHGSCIGADTHFQSIVEENREIEVHIHPGTTGKKRSWIDADVIHDIRPYPLRNRDIVDAVEVLIATPSGEEVVRSGTWSTVRRAREKGIPIYIVRPDGLVEVTS